MKFCKNCKWLRIGFYANDCLRFREYPDTVSGYKNPYNPKTARMHDNMCGLEAKGFEPRKWFQGIRFLLGIDKDVYE